MHHEYGVSVTFPPRDVFQRGAMAVAHGLAIIFFPAALMALWLLSPLPALPRWIYTIVLVIAGPPVVWKVAYILAAIVQIPTARVSVSAVQGVLSIDDNVIGRRLEVDAGHLRHIRAGRWWLWPSRGTLRVGLRREARLRQFNTEGQLIADSGTSGVDRRGRRSKQEQDLSFASGYPLEDVTEAATLLSDTLGLETPAKPKYVAAPGVRRLLPPGVPRTMLRTDTEERILRGYKPRILKQEMERRKKA